jgi:hypothetical protein
MIPCLALVFCRQVKINQKARVCRPRSGRNSFSRRFFLQTNASVPNSLVSGRLEQIELYFGPFSSVFRPHIQNAQKSVAHQSTTPLSPVTYSPLRHYVTSPSRLTAFYPHIRLATSPSSRISISPLAQAFQYPHCHDASPPSHRNSNSPQHQLPTCPHVPEPARPENHIALLTDPHTPIIPHPQWVRAPLGPKDGRPLRQKPA